MSFETIIGLEIHSELRTKSKIFCSCSTEFGAEPNANTCPVCLGIPGTLPLFNNEAVNLAIKAGLSLNCHINQVNKMDRKNYFYPDLPKAFQTSQQFLPICTEGHLEYMSEGIQKSVRINRIHMEEDAGKLVHLEDEPFSLIDYNRVGVPLIEIVTEPDLRSAQEAVDFLKALKAILEYGEVSDCRMEQGSIRCDANISMRQVGSDVLNTRVELKNINSFKELQKAIEKEQRRQKELYEFGEESKIKQETRRWDAAKGRTIPMRSKEESHDYRFFPEPDIPTLVISDERVNNIKSNLPEMPAEKTKRFNNDYGIAEKDVDILVSDKKLSDFFEEVINDGASPKAAASWILVDVLRILKERKLESSDIPVKASSLSALLKIIESGKISNTAAKDVFNELCDSDKSPEQIIEEKGLSQISSSDEIIKLIDEIIAANPNSIADFKSGKPQASGFLMGQVMKASKGKANPKVAKQLLDEALSKL